MSYFAIALLLLAELSAAMGREPEAEPTSSVLSQAIDLNGYDFSEGQDITELLEALCEANAPVLHITLPGNVKQLQVGRVDFTKCGVSRLIIDEPGSPITIRHNAEIPDRNVMFSLANYSYVKIGGPQLNITFDGLHKGVRGGHNARAHGAKAEGLWSFSHRKPGLNGKLIFQANVSNSRIYGIDHRGPTSGVGRAERIEIAGKFENSGVRLNSGYQELHLASLVLSDPFGVALGWDGTASKKNNGWNIKPPYWERARGISITYANKVTGRFTLEYGGSSWFISTVKQLGESAAEPLHIRYKDLGYSSTGVRINPVGFFDTGGKVDHMGPNPLKAPRFIRVEEIEHDYGYALRQSVVFEATSEDGNSGKGIYFNEGLHLQMDNISSVVNTSHLLYRGDFSRGHSITGNARSSHAERPIVLMHEDDILSDYRGSSVAIRSIDKLNKVAKNNRIERAVFVPESSVFIHAGSQNTKLQDVVFEGLARPVIQIQNKSRGHLPVSVDINRVTAPAGSTIEAQVNSNVSVTLDGKKVSLPYSFR